MKIPCVDLHAIIIEGITRNASGALGERTLVPYRHKIFNNVNIKMCSKYKTLKNF